MADSVQVILPKLPTVEFYARPEFSIRDATNSVLLSYDTTTMAGVVYHLEARTWNFLVPVSFAVFLRYLCAEGFRIADTADAQRWFGACTNVGAGCVH